MASPGRLDTILGPWRLIKFSIWFHWVAFKDALFKDGIAALAHPQRIRDAAAAKLLIVASDGFISHENTTPVPSLVYAAQGKILDLGPGPGNQIHRFNPSIVDFIYAVDPNPNFGDAVSAQLKKHDLQDKYKLLTCGVENSEILRREGVTEGSMDTVLSIQVLCAVEDIRSVAKEVYKLLKPGGKFIFWEHGRNKDSLTAITQAGWNPAWSALVGCCLTRDIKAAILAAGEWENPGDIEEKDEPYSFLPRTWGVLIKKA